jgi:Flp pilus assembly pilin Flp
MQPRSRLFRRWRQLWHAAEAVSATEYAILLALIVVGAMTAIRAIGERIYNIYGIIETTIPTAS